MSRKLARREERSRSLGRRLLAGATTVFLALGMTVGGAGAALAGEKTPTLRSSTSSPEFYSGNGLTCNDFVTTLGDNVNINEGATGTYTGASGTWGTFGWVAGNVFTWAISAGWTVDLCIKGSNTVIWINDASGTGSYDFKGLQGHGISHMNFTDARFTPPTLQTSQSIDCTSAINGTGRPLVNGDHINMRVQYQGREIRLDSYVEPANRVGDPTSESGLLIRTTVDGVQFSVPLSNQQVASGLLVVNYSSYLTGSWTVTWVQYNERYAANLLPLTCGTQTPAATGDVDVDPPTCELASPNIGAGDLSGSFDGFVITNPVGSNGGTFSVVFTAADGTRFASPYPGANSSLTYAVGDGGRTLTVTGTLAGPDATLCAPVATAAVTVVQPGCFSATTFAVNPVGTALATFADPVSNVNGTVSIVATATGNALFAAGNSTTEEGVEIVVNEARTTKTFTVTQDPQLPNNDPLCVQGFGSVELAFNAPKCETAETLNVGGFGFINARIKEGTLVQGNGTFQVTFEMTTAGVFDTNKTATQFAKDGRSVTFRYNENFRELTLSGVLAGPDIEDCIVIPVVDPFDSLDDCLLGQNYTLEFVNGITYMVTVDPDGQAGPQAPLAPFAVVFEPNQLVATLIPTPGSFVSVMPVANPGYVLAENQPKPFSRTFAVYGPNDCQLTDLPNWPASVSSTNESCTPLSKTSGVITVQRSSGPSENPNPVRYYLFFGTPQQVELTSATNAVAPGTYVVTAQAFLSTDSVNNSGRTLTFPALTVGAASDEDCELDTLAFTGAGEIVNWLGVAAVLMVLAGIGFVIRRHRVEV